MLKKVRRKKSWICPFFQIHLGSLSWAATHPPSKFCASPFSSFCAILFTNQPTTQKPDMAENISSLSELIIVSEVCCNYYHHFIIDYLSFKFKREHLKVDFKVEA